MTKSQMRLVSPEEEQTFQELTTLFWLERVEDKAQSKEARLISALDQSSGESDRVAVSEVAAAYNEGLELKQQLGSDSIGHRLRAIGFKGDRGGSKVRTRVIMIDRQLLAPLKVRWGLEFPEETLEPLKKVSEVSKVSTQLCPQIQTRADTSILKVSLEVSEEVSNLKQIQTDTSVSGGGAEVDYFLADGTRVIIVEQQLLAILKLRWGLELSEDAAEHPQKIAQSAQLPPQLQPQIQKLMGGSRAEPPSKPPVEPPNLNQIQAGGLSSSVEGGEDAEVDYSYLMAPQLPQGSSLSDGGS